MSATYRTQHQSMPAHGFLTSFARAGAVATTLLWLAGCATDRLDAAPPKGVDLTGEWQFNPNLSDDPQKMPADDSSAPTNSRHHSGRGRGGGSSGGGLPPFGMPGGAGGRTGGTDPDGSEDFTGAGSFPGSGKPLGNEKFPAGESLTGSASAGQRFSIVQGGPGGGTGGGGGAGGGGRSRGNRFGHLLDAPAHMTIEQKGGKLTIQSKSASGELTTEEYVSGQKSDISVGQNTAERNVGWKGNIFVIDTKVKSGPTKEDDYALDDDGRLIVATLMTGGRMPKVDIRRVYDRVKGAQGVRQ